MKTFTPGPWEAIKPRQKGGHWKVGAVGTFGAGRWAGAKCLWDLAAIRNGRPDDTLETEESNARLIAAAPDLLEALEAVVAIADRDTDVFNKAKAAIRRARGEES